MSIRVDASGHSRAELAACDGAANEQPARLVLRQPLRCGQRDVGDRQRDVAGSGWVDASGYRGGRCPARDGTANGQPARLVLRRRQRCGQCDVGDRRRGVARSSHHLSPMLPVSFRPSP